MSGTAPPPPPPQCQLSPTHPPLPTSRPPPSAALLHSTSTPRSRSHKKNIIQSERLRPPQSQLGLTPIRLRLPNLNFRQALRYAPLPTSISKCPPPVSGCKSYAAFYPRTSTISALPPSTTNRAAPPLQPQYALLPTSISKSPRSAHLHQHSTPPRSKASGSIPETSTFARPTPRPKHIAQPNSRYHLLASASVLMKQSERLRHPPNLNFCKIALFNSTSS